MPRSAAYGALRRVHDVALSRLRRDRRLARALLGIEPAGPDHEVWDYTTLLLYRAMRPRVRPGLRVWDLGCGPELVLARIACRLAPVEVVASDLEPTCVAVARRIVERLRLPITVLQSDLGASVHGRFDLVLFNAPYLPLDRPHRLPTSRPRTGPEADLYLRRFGGGPEGTETIARFLDGLGERLRPGGSALLGFNRVYVSPTRVELRLAAHGLDAVDRVTAWWNPSIVLVLEPRS